VVNLICSGFYFGPAVHRDGQIEHPLNIEDFVLKSIKAEATTKKSETMQNAGSPSRQKVNFFLDYDMSRFALTVHCYDPRQHARGKDAP
jgi:hypothetical protein